MHKTLILSLLLFLVSVDGQATEKFELYNRCQPINLVVEYLSEDAKKIGLTRETIINSVESRLRSARIYNKNGLEFLYVKVSVGRNAYSYDTEFRKWAISYGESGKAITWSIGGSGTHGGNAGYILPLISQSIDRFIVEYLRVNEKDCK